MVAAKVARNISQKSFNEWFFYLDLLPEKTRVP